MAAVTVPLRSTAISSASYDPDTRVMEVTFVKGRTYTHENVPESVFEGLVSADSAGRYYSQNIKDQY